MACDADVSPPHPIDDRCEQSETNHWIITRYFQVMRNSGRLGGRETTGGRRRQAPAHAAVHGRPAQIESASSIQTQVLDVNVTYKPNAFIVAVEPSGQTRTDIRTYVLDDAIKNILTQFSYTQAYNHSSIDDSMSRLNDEYGGNYTVHEIRHYALSRRSRKLLLSST